RPRLVRRLPTGTARRLLQTVPSRIPCFPPLGAQLYPVFLARCTSRSRRLPALAICYPTLRCLSRVLLTSNRVTAASVRQQAPALQFSPCTSGGGDTFAAGGFLFDGARR